jgi:Arc/MetJ-type ribon-helix-helix transcriptional regulator
MKVHLSARIDADLAQYLERFREEHRLKTRSEALETAIRALRDRTLEREYAIAMDEWEASGDAARWERTVADGLDEAG